MKKLTKSFKCKIGLHKWIIGFGWSNPKRFDVCSVCNHKRWVDDYEGNQKLKKHLQWLEDNKINLMREDRINKLLDDDNK